MRRRKEVLRRSRDLHASAWSAPGEGSRAVRARDAGAEARGAQEAELWHGEQDLPGVGAAVPQSRDLRGHTALGTGNWKRVVEVWVGRFKLDARSLG